MIYSNSKKANHMYNKTSTYNGNLRLLMYVLPISYFSSLFFSEVINMENWVNGTIREINETDHGIYYSIQSRDPLLSNCEPTILFDEVKVRTDKNLPLNLFQRSFIPYSREQKHVLLFRKSEIWLFKVSITNMLHIF